MMLVSDAPQVNMTKNLKEPSPLTVCLFDALVYKFKDIGFAASIVQSLKRQGADCTDLQDRMSMIEMIKKNDLDSAERLAKSKLNSENQKLAERLFSLERTRFSVNHSIDSYQGLARTESKHTLEESLKVGKFLLSSHSDVYFRHRLIRRIERLLYESHHLSLLLNAALQYQNILQHGRRKATSKADIKSFVYLSSFSVIVSTKCWDDHLFMLQKLAKNVSTLGQFGSRLLLTRISKFLSKCMIKFPAQTIEVLQEHTEFSNEIFRHCQWSPLDMVTKPVLRTFDIIEQYNLHENTFNKNLNILNIGEQCAHALQLRENQIFDPDYTESIEVMNSSTYTVKNEEIWSVCGDCTGSYVLYGTENGKLFLHNVHLDKHSEISKLDFPAGSQIGTERIKSHPTKPGLFAAMGAGALTVIDATNELRKVFQFNTQPNSYGDICWHPDDPYTLFYCNDTLGSLFVVKVSSLTAENKWSFKYSFGSVVYCGGTHLALLTTKLQGKRQHIIMFDYETGITIADTELPEVPCDGVYSTMICSRWDSRTIMLISQPNIIMLLDKCGERPTRLIYGPNQTCLMMKAEFFGLMDKYILVTSEMTAEKHPRALLINRFTGDLAAQLLGHRKQVNDVAFVNTPGNPRLVTCSDDSHLNIYPLNSLA